MGDLDDSVVLFLAVEVLDLDDLLDEGRFGSILGVDGVGSEMVIEIVGFGSGRQKTDFRYFSWLIFS